MGIWVVSEWLGGAESVDGGGGVHPCATMAGGHRLEWGVTSKAGARALHTHTYADLAVSLARLPLALARGSSAEYESSEPFVLLSAYRVLCAWVFKRSD
jgi:hypothetical protein